MHLILWRHAEAEDGAPDEKRKLTPKGEKQAAAMAQWLKPRLPKEALILASPAQRAQQTVSALTDKFETIAQIGTGASCADILAAARWPVHRGAVVVVGHQPTLGMVAALLLAGAEQQWSIKKGAIWWISRRQHHQDGETVLRAIISPDLL